MEHARERDPKDLAELAAQSAWARRLAIALARDVQAGEDLAQEAMLASLRHQPSGNARSWLARVLRNLARLRRRSEGRRDAREREAARPDSPDDPALVLQRIELQEALLGAVRALPEPYRNTILLRWFEELEPEEIARRTDTPVRTVHTRLHRALALLREELDRRSRGDRSRWLAAWLPLVPPPHSPLPWALAMQAKTKLVIAAVSLAAVASLWIALRPFERTLAGVATPLAGEKVVFESERASDTPMKSGANGSDRSAVDTVALAGGTAVATPTGLGVRSSIGLELVSLEWQTPDGDWLCRDLNQNRCETTSMKFPCRVRAPGHLPATATRDGDELVLEPDELLILEGHDLRSCTSAIRIDWPYHNAGDPGEPISDEIQRVCMCGYLTSDRWAMAVSHDLAGGAYHEGATAEVIWREGYRADVHFRTEAGLRGTWTVPCDDRPPSAPLTVHLQRPPGVAAGPIVLRVVDCSEQRSDGRTENFDWGSVVAYGRESLWAPEVRVNPDASEHVYEALRIGEPLLVFARDETSGAFGRVVFDHDGSSRTIALRPAFELVARLVSAVDASPITSARFGWRFPDGKEQVYGWHCSSGRTFSYGDGVFRRLLPEEPLLRPEEPLETPPRLILSIDAPGFEFFERAFETAGAGRLDCGELRLTPKVGHLELAPGHGLTPKSVEWQGLRVSARPELQWSVRSGALGADGALSVYLLESEESTSEKPLFRAGSWQPPELSHAAWPAEPSRWLVLHVLLEERDEDWLFERRADGRFAAVPRSERELVLECAALPPQDTPNSAWLIGWMWQGQWGQLCGGPGKVGEVARVRVSFPAGDASIYWSAKGPPPGVFGAPKETGWSIPVEEIHGKLVLK